MTTFSNSGTNFDKLNTVGTLPRALPETSISREGTTKLDLSEFFRIKNLLVESTCSEVPTVHFPPQEKKLQLWSGLITHHQEGVELL